MAIAPSSEMSSSKTSNPATTKKNISPATSSNVAKKLFSAIKQLASSIDQVKNVASTLNNDSNTSTKAKEIIPEPQRPLKPNVQNQEMASTSTTTQNIESTSTASTPKENKELEKIINALNDFLFIDESREAQIAFFVQHEKTFKDNVDNIQQFLLDADMDPEMKKGIQKRFDDAFSVYQSIQDSSQYKRNKRSLEVKKMSESYASLSLNEDEGRRKLIYDLTKLMFSKNSIDKKLDYFNIHEEKIKKYFIQPLQTRTDENEKKQIQKEYNHLLLLKDELNVKKKRAYLIESLNELVAVEKSFDAQMAFFVDNAHIIEELFVKNLLDVDEKTKTSLQKQYNDLLLLYKELKEHSISDYLMMLQSDPDKVKSEDLQNALHRIKIFFSDTAFQKRFSALKQLTQAYEDFASQLPDHISNAQDPLVRERVNMLLTRYASNMTDKTKDLGDKYCFDEKKTGNGLKGFLENIFIAPFQKISKYRLSLTEIPKRLKEYCEVDPAFEEVHIGDIADETIQQIYEFGNVGKTKRATASDSPAKLLANFIEINKACKPVRNFSLIKRGFGIFGKSDAKLHDIPPKWKRQLKQLEQDITAIYMDTSLTNSPDITKQEINEIKCVKIRDKIIQTLDNIQQHPLYHTLYKDTALENELKYLAGLPIDTKTKRLNKFTQIDDLSANAKIEKNIIAVIKDIFQPKNHRVVKPFDFLNPFINPQKSSTAETLTKTILEEIDKTSKNPEYQDDPQRLCEALTSLITLTTHKIKDNALPSNFLRKRDKAISYLAQIDQRQIPIPKLQVENDLSTKEEISEENASSAVFGR